MSIILNITVPDEWATKVLEAFEIITGTQMSIESRRFVSNLQDEFDGRWDFVIQSKQPDETNKQFGERVLRELGKAIVCMVDKAEDDVRYRNEVNAIALPSSDVPEDILG